MSNSQAYASALERAKQIVTKISSDESSSVSAGMKRTAQAEPDDNSSAFYNNSEKRPYLNDRSTASAAAAEAVARLNQKLVQQQPTTMPYSNSGAQSGGYAGSPVATIPQQHPAGMGFSSITIQIPDRMVGLIIGKKGEQITALQAESNCRVQIAQEQSGPERPITLSGSHQQIEIARKMINEIMKRAEGRPQGNAMGMGSGIPNHMMGGDNMASVEILIPGNKAGLIIGKGGETIKAMQEEHKVKMVLIQQTNQATIEDKPLKISGDPAKVEHVRNLVLELINSKQTPPMGMSNSRYGGMEMHQSGGGMGMIQEVQKFAVPADKAGLVIGKGGESIKVICRMTDCHVEISKDLSPSPALKLFNLRGTPESIEKAKKLISERAGIQTHKQTEGSYSSGYNNYAYMQDANAGAAAFQQSNGGITPTINPITGQPDYSAAWVDYYRKLGMHDQAEKILLQAQQQNLAAAAYAGHTGAATAANGAALTAGAAAGPGQGLEAQWQAWQQWQQQSQWQQQQQQWTGASAATAGAQAAGQN